MKLSAGFLAVIIASAAVMPASQVSEWVEDALRQSGVRKGQNPPAQQCEQVLHARRPHQLL